MNYENNKINKPYGLGCIKQGKLIAKHTKPLQSMIVSTKRSVRDYKKHRKLFFVNKTS